MASTRKKAPTRRTPSARTRSAARLAAVTGRGRTVEVAALVPEVKLLPHTDRRMRALGQGIARLRAEKERDYLQRCLEIGRRLRQARTRLKHGSWEPWLRQSAAISPRAARNYVALSTWAEERPRQLARWKDLGASKLFVIATASNRVRTALRKETLRKLRDMSTAELRLLVGRLGASDAPVPLARRVSRLHRRLRTVVREVHELLEAGALPQTEIDALRALLREASEALHG